MSKASINAARGAAPHHRRRRGKRRAGGMKPAVTAGRRVSYQKSVKPSASAAVSSPEPRSRAQQVFPDRAYVRRDLIRVGIVAGISILILIILRLSL